VNVDVNGYDEGKGNLLQYGKSYNVTFKKVKNDEWICIGGTISEENKQYKLRVKKNTKEVIICFATEKPNVMSYRILKVKSEN
jgi:hypothetical protein